MATCLLHGTDRADSRRGFTFCPAHPRTLALLTPHRVRKSSQDTHRGFGYVEFAQAEDAHEAIDNMDQAELYGRVIKVNQAKPQKAAGEKLGSKTAVWEQVSFFFPFPYDYYSSSEILSLRFLGLTYAHVREIDR